MKLEQYKLWTALVTPFDKKDQIVYADLKKLLLKQQQAGNGVLILGSTGEALALSLEEKKQIVKFVSELKLSVPIMVGVGGFRLEDQLAWIEYCQQYDVASFLLVTPLYAKPSAKGQVAWFKALLDKADRPCMLYNIPSRTGVALHPKVLTKLHEHPNFWAVKEASGTLEDFQKYRDAAPDLAIYSGNDDLMPHYGLMGCQGLVSVVANAWPDATKIYVDKCLKGKGVEVLPLWQAASAAMFQVSNPIPVKALLCEKQWISTPNLRLPLSHKDLKSVGLLLDMDSAIFEWWQQNAK